MLLRGYLLSGLPEAHTCRSLSARPMPGNTLPRLCISLLMLNQTYNTVIIQDSSGIVKWLFCAAAEINFQEYADLNCAKL